MAVDVEQLQALLGGRYTVERELGSGGMATVYRAVDNTSEEPVAIKVLKRMISALVGPDRFLNEIRVTASLEHPHILPLTDSGQQGDVIYYVMPLADGPSLRAQIDADGQLPLEDALSTIAEIGQALEFSHGQGVVHRDVKPDNIMLGASGSQLMDFGIAKALDVAGGTQLTESGIIIGTPHYMSPEQATSSKDVEPPSDQYSLACVLYEMLTGEPLFTGATVDSIIRKHVLVEPPRVAVLRPDLPEEMDDALRRALVKKPEDRYPSVAEFVSAVAGG